MNEPVPGISAFPDDDNARYFHVLVTGPADVWAKSINRHFMINLF